MCKRSTGGAVAPGAPGGASALARKPVGPARTRAQHIASPLLLCTSKIAHTSQTPIDISQNCNSEGQNSAAPLHNADTPGSRLPANIA